MKPLWNFVKTTLIGGALFMLPVVLVVVLVAKAIHMLAKVSEPVAEHLPLKSVAGIAAVDLVAFLLLLVGAFLGGLVARTGFGRRIGGKVEQLVVMKMPGYSLLKSMTSDVQNIETSTAWKVVLANIDDAWLIAFQVERHASGMLTVFIPSAPTPTAGSLYFLTEQQVKRLNVSVASAVRCIKELGIGSKELLDQVQFSSDAKS